MKRVAFVLAGLLLTGCGYNVYDAEPVSNGDLTVVERGPATEIPDCFTIEHRWSKATGNGSESFGIYCREEVK